ncbi:hypothetical protein D3C78_877180 [compost metagenome]
MNDLVTLLVRWSVRIFLLIAATVFFLSLLAAASLLALVWGVRALWARLTGRPVTPWTMGVSPAAAWSSVYRSRTVWTAPGGPAAAAETEAGAAGFSRRGGILRGSDDVVDVQPREVREQ